MPPPTLPNDIVAIDTGKKTFLFYVYANNDDELQLSYLESEKETGTGNYSVNKIATARDPWKKKKEEVEIFVSPNNTQVAAITWPNSKGQAEIRVYFVDKADDNIREVCKTGNGDWRMGALSWKPEANKNKVSPHTSISASVHMHPDGKQYNLRVFAAPAEQKNHISVYKWAQYTDSDIEYDDEVHWLASIITSKITNY